MFQRITDFDAITADLDPTGAIESYLWGELMDCQWETLGQLVSQLESASCAAGSWSGMIYTRDILDRLSDPQWQDDIDAAIADYRDNTGESPDLSDLSSMVTFAVDWGAFNLACKIRHKFSNPAVVTAPVDSMDPNPDRIAFPSVWEAEDWISEEVERRIAFRVEHSPYSVTDEELDEWREEELNFMTLDEERL